jgi:radical SAM superfamily enzyme YgiQ (UPF0313 family)
VNPEALIVVGGWHCLSRAQDFVDSTDVFDIVVLGDGEKALFDIVSGKIQKAPGEKARIIMGERLDEEDYRHFGYLIQDYRSYCRGLRNIKNVENIEFNLSNHCPFECMYCDNRLLSKRKWIAFDVDRCIEMINNSLNIFSNLRSICFNESVFGLNSEWRKEFLTQVNRQDYKLRFYTQTRIDILNRTDIELLNESNFFLFFGIESFSKEMLKIMKKSSNPEGYISKTKENLNLIKENEISHEIYLLITHPGETEETSQECYSNLKEFLDDKIYIQVFFYYYWLPSFIDHYEYYKSNYGSLLEGEPEWWMQKDPLTILGNMRYVPSSKKGETFEAAYERSSKIIRFWKRIDSIFQRKNN